jgi:hypothetical protein
LPAEIENLYAFFLHQIQVRVESLNLVVPVEGGNLAIWPAVHLPALAALAVAMEPLSPEQLKSFAGIEARPSYIHQALGDLHQFLDEVGDGYSLYHATLAEFLTSSATKDHPQNRDLYQDPLESNRQYVSYYRHLVGGWVSADWSRLDRYGWQFLLSHTQAAEVQGTHDLLFEICDRGFLEAKYQHLKNAVQLEDDWQAVFRACQETNDYGRFTRYGLVRADQFMDISPMLSTPVARTAAQLAVSAGVEGEIKKLAGEIALIPHLHARILAELALLSTLVASQSESKAVAPLLDSLESTLDALLPGPDRDRYRVDYLQSLVKLGIDGWKEQAHACLSEVQATISKISLDAILAQKFGEDGDPETAYGLLSQALDLCEEFAVEEDVLGEILQLTTEAVYDSPAGMLTYALLCILEAAPASGPEACKQIVEQVRLQSNRLWDQLYMDDASQQSLLVNQAAIKALDQAGLDELAGETAREMMRPYLSTSEDEEDDPDVTYDYDYPQLAKGQLAVLPTVAGYGSEADMASWQGVFDAYLAGIHNTMELAWVLQTICELPVEEVGAAGMISLLDIVETRSKTIWPDQLDTQIIAGLALGHGRAGDCQRAQEFLSLILDPTQPVGYCEDPSGLANEVITLWATACLCGDRDLVTRALAWLRKTADLIPFDVRQEVWLLTIPAVTDIPDQEQARQAFDQLKLLLIDNLAPREFLALAFRQFADANAMLGNNTETKRFLAESLALGREVMTGMHRVGLIARAARIYAHIDEIEDSARLIDEILQAAQQAEDPDFQADILSAVIHPIGTLAGQSPAGKEQAGRLLGGLIDEAISIDVDQLALRVCNSLAAMTRAQDLDTPAETIASRFDLNGQGRDPREILDTAWLYHQLGMQADALQALETVEGMVAQFPVESDYQREEVCRFCENLVDFTHGVDQALRAQPWRQLAHALAGQVEDPMSRTAVYINLAKIEARCEDSASSRTWLAQAIQAWFDIEDRFLAGSFTGGLFWAWDAMPDADERWQRRGLIHAVINQVEDLSQRDIWLARMVASFLCNPERFFELIPAITSRAGVDELLNELYERRSVPPGILPSALYVLLQAASRISRLSFAGYGLLATQAGIAHQAVDPHGAATALALIEATMRERVTLD